MTVPYQPGRPEFRRPPVGPPGSAGMAQAAAALRRRRPRFPAGNRGLHLGQRGLAPGRQPDRQRPPGFAGPPTQVPMQPFPGMPPSPSRPPNPGGTPSGGPSRPPGGQVMGLPALADILRQLGGPSRRLPILRPGQRTL